MRLALATTLMLAAASASVADEPVPAGSYTVDKAHTSLLFRVSHMSFSEFTGRFTTVNADLSFDPSKIANSHVTVKVDPRSIATDNPPEGFLAMLAGRMWLDADRFPEMVFRSNKVRSTGASTFRIEGTLTLHGITKPVTLEATYNGGYAGNHYDPHARVGFSAHGSFKRSDFGISNGIPTPGTNLGVGDEVEVIVESEFSGPEWKAVAPN